MNRKFYYGARAAYSIIRTPMRRILFGGRIKMPILQNISPSARIRVFGKGCIMINGRLSIEDGVLIEAVGGRIEMEHCFINRHTTIVSMESIVVKNGVSIGPNVSIYDHDHNISYDSSKGAFVTKPILIDENVWIGANSVILKGVSIGKNAVIAAGSVVNKDVESNTIVAGVPAKKIRMRTNMQEISTITEKRGIT